MKKITDYMIPEESGLRERMDEIMGGNILKLRSEELREEGYTEGLIEGQREGRIEGIAEGREEGKAEGKTEEKKIIALRMYRAGMGLQEISDMVDMPEQDIREWLSN